LISRSQLAKLAASSLTAQLQDAALALLLAGDNECMRFAGKPGLFTLRDRTLFFAQPTANGCLMPPDHAARREDCKSIAAAVCVGGVQ